MRGGRTKERRGRREDIKEVGSKERGTKVQREGRDGKEVVEEGSGVEK